jgi:UDP:flavonoid glycosyltransferase YjiC (YdhE family)
VRAFGHVQPLTGARGPDARRQPARARGTEAAGEPTRARRLRILLGAFGDPGHAFPMIGMGRALAARGHDVTLQTWERWRPAVEAEGMTFAPAPEYHVFPIPSTGRDGRTEPLDFYEAAVYATRDTLPLVRDLHPDAVVSDILTLGPALAAEIEGVPCATLIPHVSPQAEPGFPVYSFGARLPRTGLGRALWRRAHLPVDRGLQRGRRALNRARERVGLPPVGHVHGGTSRQLALVATFPQLEYPRAWPSYMHVIGPLLWEPPADDVQPPPTPADEAEGWPLVLVAPSTSQDPDHRLLHAALRGLAAMPVRVLATWNRRLPSSPLSVPANARVVDWLSYARTMPHCDAVLCHAGHGTLVRALACGCPVVACPVAGDMNENAARVDWAGAGVRLPRRFISPRGLRRATERVLADPSFGTRAQEMAAWLSVNDPGAHAAALVERLGACVTPKTGDAWSRKPTQAVDEPAGHSAVKKLRGWDSNPQPSD